MLVAHNYPVILEEMLNHGINIDAEAREDIACDTHVIGFRKND
jgi:hypothetical protein